MNLWRNRKGSYTLEAAITIPVLLVILIFLINLINVCMVYIAMDHAVSEAVKLVAAYSYPLSQAGSSSSGSGTGITNGDLTNTNLTNTNLTNTNLTGINMTGSDITRNNIAWNDIVGQLINSLKKNGSSVLLDLAVKEIIKAKITDFYPLGNINDHSFVLSQVKVINPTAQGQALKEVNGIEINSEDIAIVAVYTVNLPVPFLPLREITLSNTAVERAWADG